MSNTRNLADVGPNLQKIVKRLQSNQKLLKLLYSDIIYELYKDPDDRINVERIIRGERKIITTCYEKLIKIVPRVGPKETAHSMIVIRLVNGKSNPGNNEFRDFRFDIEVFVLKLKLLLGD